MSNQTMVYALPQEVLLTFQTIDQFIYTKRVARVSPRTLFIYTHELKRFADYCQDLSIDAVPQLTPAIIRKFLQVLSERGLNAGSVHIAYRVLKTYLLWVWDEYDLQGKPPIDKVQIKQPKPDPITGVDAGTVKQLMDVCYLIRDRAILAVLFDTGIRRSELLDLNVGDADLMRGVLTIRHGKGDKFRRVFVGQKTRKLLRKYMSEKPYALEDSALFTSEGGERLTIPGLHRMVRRLAQRAKIPTPGLHDFRRGAALAMLRGGADILSVSKILGHGDIRTTLRYLAVMDDDLAKVHARTSPMDYL